MSAEEEPRPEHPGCVLGIAFGLLLTALLGLGSLRLGASRVLDPDEVLAEDFTHGELPFSLVVVEAAELPDRRRVVRLAHPDFVDPPPKEEESDDADPDGADGVAGGEELEESPPEPPKPPPRPEMIPGTPPTEVFLVFYSGAEASARAFREGGSGGGSADGGGGPRGRSDGGFAGMTGLGGPVVMEAGDLDWGELRAGFVHERRVEGATARDEVRVNLSGQGRYCVVFARWPENHAGSRAKVEELLAAFAPAPPTPDDAP